MGRAGLEGAGLSEQGVDGGIEELQGGGTVEDEADAGLAVGLTRSSRRGRSSGALGVLS